MKRATMAMMPRTSHMGTMKVDSGELTADSRAEAGLLRFYSLGAESARAPERESARKSARLSQGDLALLCSRVLSFPAVLRLPVGDEQVGLVGLAAVAVGGPDELPAVGREHGEAVERRVERDLLELVSAGHRRGSVYQVELEVL